MKHFAVLIFLFLGLIGKIFAASDTLQVLQTSDFKINGKGSNAAWEKTPWVRLQNLSSEIAPYSSQFKILYSAKGIYVLMEGDDNKITTQYKKDFDDLYKGDVFEVFFHPNPKEPLYFEYEINALNKELVLLVPNFNKKFFGWIPWHYDGDKKVQKAVSITQEKGKMKKWSAEMFFPYTLFNPLENTPPQQNSYWRANFYRLDYDHEKMAKSAWMPVKGTFHEFEKFGYLKFN